MPPPSASPALHLKLLEETFAVFQLPIDAPIPSYVLEHLTSSASGKFMSVTRTSDEISIVCNYSVLGPETAREEWKCIQVVGPMDLSAPNVTFREWARAEEAGQA